MFYCSKTPRFLTTHRPILAKQGGTSDREHEYQSKNEDTVRYYFSRSVVNGDVSSASIFKLTSSN